MKSQLELTITEASYGNKQILGKLSLHLAAGESVGIIGPNGAGKTSVLKVLMGSSSIAAQAKITKDGVDILRTSVARRKGRIAYVPQQHRVFASLSIFENVRIGWSLSDRTENFEKMYVMLEKIFPILSQKNKLSGSLSGGEQQMVALARALAQKPDFLILDEPTVGVSPRGVKTLLGHLKEIREQFGVGLLIVEHNLQALFEITDRIYVISEGLVTLEGTPDEIRSSQKLKEIYFGK